LACECSLFTLLFDIGLSEFSLISGHSRRRQPNLLLPNVGGSWAGWCAALMMRAGSFPDWSARSTAHLAYLASNIVSHDWNAAPPGALHWWNIPGITEGHVAMAIDRRGWALMASSRVTESWGQGPSTFP